MTIPKMGIKAIIGFAPIQHDPNTGELFVDTDQIERLTAKKKKKSNYREISGDLEDEDEDDYEENEDEDTDEAEISGRRRGRRRKGGKRKKGKRPRNRGRRNRDDEGLIYIGRSATLKEAGEFNITLRAQYDFEVEDMIVSCSVPGARITTLKFADKSMIDSDQEYEGIAADTFSSFSRVTESRLSHFVPAGLDIVIVGYLPEEATINFTFRGQRG